MKILIALCLLAFLPIKGYCQVPNDDCVNALDYGIFPFSANPSCPNGGAPYVGDNDDLTNVTPSSPFLSMTGCQGYASATTTLADDIWYKYRGWSNATKIWMFGVDTLHVNFYYGTNCNALQPSACFTYLPAYNDTIFEIFSHTDTTNYYNYIQVSSNVPGKQFWYFVCLDQPTFAIPPTIYGTIQINNNVSINDVNQSVYVSVFPTAFSDEIYVKTNSIDILQFIVTDLSSRRISQETFMATYTMNTLSLARGIYLYEVRNGNRVIKQGKIVRN